VLYQAEPRPDNKGSPLCKEKRGDHSGKFALIITLADLNR
jgi:hypothetical protein